MNTQLIGADAYSAALSLSDLTDPVYGLHALQPLLRSVIEQIQQAWGCALIVHRGERVVSTADNYDLLGYTPDAAARDARYSRYVSPTSVLRTHTSALIPGLLRSLAPSPRGDLLLACPGVVYRRDVIDRLHVGEPHQLDLWRIRQGALGERDLSEMIERVVQALLPGATYRTHPAAHPYTEHGLEVEVKQGERWVELLECGLAAPAVLEQARITPERYRGLAMGIGLDRALMLRKEIDDIRLLRSSDERVAAQMRDLDIYRPVSSMPPIRRDLSIAVEEETTVEQLGDRVRSALGSQADAVELIDAVSETPINQLPPQAIARIGMSQGQKNVLLKVVLRHPTCTLTSEEANRLRNDIYAALHEGTNHQWAG
jgi:phenylalanyl-tRNA synthetase alpha chain